MSVAPAQLDPGPSSPLRTVLPVFTGKYLSVASSRRDGTTVATPVWFVQDGPHLLVETDSGSYKVRRIRRDPSVRVAPCTASGRLLSEPVPARARFLPDGEIPRVERLMGRKYRFDRILVVPIYRLVQRLRHGRTPKGAPVILEITPGREGG